jgi:F-type H+-transporting ATPase subunit a
MNIKTENLLNILYSPLEQFEILSLFKILGFNLTNQFYFLLVLLSFLCGLFYFLILDPKTKSLYIIPNRWQFFLESIYLLILNLVKDNINGPRGQRFFPIIFTLFLFIAGMNLIGLIPYSYTVTSHFIVTLALSLSVFIGMNIICIRTHKLEFFSLFLPAGTSFALAFLLVPVELISYIFKPLSLAIRLFCNMMAGHTLLKVFAGFSWSLMHFSGVLFFLQAIPLLILIPLYGLEFGVALIQAFVFSLLTCIYLNDAINLH